MDGIPVYVVEVADYKRYSMKRACKILTPKGMIKITASSIRYL